MKTALPWMVMVALLVGGYFLFASVKKEGDAQQAQLQQLNQSLEELRAENGELKKITLQKDELDRLRKEHDELLSLRGEVQRSRQQIKQLTGELATAKSQSARAQEAQQQATTESQNLRNQAELALGQDKAAKAQYTSCINNLHQIDNAKQQWALEFKKASDAVPTPADIAPYLQNASQIACPAGGIYTLNPVSVAPTCSIPSHVLQR